MTGPASAERPEHHEVLKEFAGEVAGDPSRVFDALAARVDPGTESSFLADPAAGLIVVQGDYWYRSEYRVSPAASGTRITQTLVNVAPGSLVVGRLTGRAAIKAAPAAFETLLAALRTP